MYCTIVPGPTSTGLGDDASSAYHRFRRMARALGSISRSFDNLAHHTISAYFGALSSPSTEAWTVLVRKTALLVERTNALAGIVGLNGAEREALDFFAAIVGENSDLLPEAGLAIEAHAQPREYISA